MHMSKSNGPSFIDHVMTSSLITCFEVAVMCCHNPYKVMHTEAVIMHLLEERMLCKVKSKSIYNSRAIISWHNFKLYKEICKIFMT